MRNVRKKSHETVVPLRSFHYFQNYAYDDGLLKYIFFTFLRFYSNKSHSGTTRLHYFLRNPRVLAFSPLLSRENLRGHALLFFLRPPVCSRDHPVR